MVEIKVERKGLDIDYELEGIIKEMLKNATTSFIDQRDYKITLTNGKEETEIITAKIEITLTNVPDTLIKKAKEEEE
jgi:hypothetical protein